MEGFEAERGVERRVGGSVEAQREHVGSLGKWAWM